MKNTYLALAIVGAVVPYAFFLDFFADSGIALPVFLGTLFVNGAAGGFLITSFVFWLFMFSRRPDGPNPALFVVLNLAIGLSCAFPAYLYWDARSKESLAQ